MREVRLMVTCLCTEWDVQIAPSECEAEKRLEVRGWFLIGTAKCPKCRKVKPVEKGELQ